MSLARDEKSSPNNFPAMLTDIFSFFSRFSINVRSFLMEFSLSSSFGHLRAWSVILIICFLRVGFPILGEISFYLPFIENVLRILGLTKCWILLFRSNWFCRCLFSCFFLAYLWSKSARKSTQIYWKWISSHFRHSLDFWRIQVTISVEFYWSG